MWTRNQFSIVGYNYIGPAAERPPSHIYHANLDIWKKVRGATWRRHLAGPSGGAIYLTRAAIYGELMRRRNSFAAKAGAAFNVLYTENQRRFSVCSTGLRTTSNNKVVGTNYCCGKRNSGGILQSGVLLTAYIPGR